MTECYEVIDLDRDESQGKFDTLSDARRCGSGLRAYAIWYGRMKVMHCEPYDGPDARVRQAQGEAPWESPS